MSSFFIEILYVSIFNKHAKKNLLLQCASLFYKLPNVNLGPDHMYPIYVYFRKY